MKLSLLAVLLGFLLDLLLGDPRRLYHPIRLIGAMIGSLEHGLRKIFRIPAKADFENGEERQNPRKETAIARREFAAGALLAVLTVTAASGTALLILLFCQWIHPYLRLAVETVMCWQLLATKSLKDESMKAYDELVKGDLAAGRRAVSMIVGRDTERLDEAGVTRAAVETVAENASDGVIAPLFYMMIGGAALGFFYKAVNTMDSMIGYKNDRYLYFGRFAARLDDAANFVPARLCALFMIAAAFFCSLGRQPFANGRQAWKIFCRDRLNHASPNSAQTEAVMAGALEVRLAGDAWYFGKLHRKKTIGDDLRPVEAADIARANALLYVTAALAVTGMGLVKWALIWLSAWL